MDVKIKLEPGVEAPEKSTINAAGLDIRAHFVQSEGYNDITELDKLKGKMFYISGSDLYLKPGGRVLIPTGMKVELPAGYEMQIRPRSGIALKYGITVLNTPGTIDADYRGDIGVILINHGKHDFCINHGDRIAQMVIARVITPRFIGVQSLEESQRGEGGFGHTGNK